MANKKHLAILKQGVTAWNEWRKKNPDIRANLKKSSLRGANLERADLSGADLMEADLLGAALLEADLHGANLGTANLREAWLFGANLFEAILIGANLTGADLRCANLSWSDLRFADLIGADIFFANLTMANLEGANFHDTGMGATVLNDVDLSAVKDLETVDHLGPSDIGIRTIYNSKGQIPEAFLRGAGVPENFITFMHSLAAQDKAFDFYSCFISYSDKDRSFAERIYADLQATGVRCWYAPEDLKIGDKFVLEIDQAIRIYDKLLLVLSATSIESAWVEHEVRAALTKEEQQNRTVLFPIRLDRAVMETTQQWAHDIKRSRHIGDFSKWKDHDCYHESFARLLRDLQADTVVSVVEEE